MSRSGYSDDYEQWSLIRWRGAVNSALRGRRGQAFLREMLDAMDAMPEKRLISSELRIGGEVCAIGAVGAARGVEMGDIDPEDNRTIAERFGVAHALACEIMYVNDELGDYHSEEIVGFDQWTRHQWREETPEERFVRVRQWIVEQIRATE